MLLRRYSKFAKVQRLEATVILAWVRRSLVFVNRRCGAIKLIIPILAAFWDHYLNADCAV